MKRRQTTRRQKRGAGRQQILAVQRLEDRRLLAFDLNAGETMLLYLVNQTRNNPQAWAERLSVSLASNQVGPFQPVVPNESLQNAAQAHSDDMLLNNMGGHTGSDGSSPGQRALRFGYETDGVNENAAAGYSVNQAPASDESLARSTNDSWFSSSLHRANMLTADWTEFGGAYSESFTESSGGSNWSWRATEVFGRYDAGPFLVGVVFNDQNADSAYNVGEGLGGVSVTVTGPNGTYSTTTMSAGAWYLKVPAGEYLVSASGGQFVGASSVPVQVSNRNSSVDFISGQSQGWVNFEQHVNSAPSLALSGGNELPAVLSGNTNPDGTTVAALLGTSFSDPDVIGLRGIAITYVPETSIGAWQYSLNQGSTWLNLGSPTDSAALLLAAEDLVRFVPNGSGTGSTVFSYRAWDRTAGQSGGTASVTSSGGQSPFSVAGARARATVIGTNTAPTLLTTGGNGFGFVYEDALSHSGTTVAHLIGTGYHDPDSASVPGIALTGLTGVESGTWSYSTDDGWSWLEIGSVAPSQALLLRPSDQLSFRPHENQTPEFSATFRLWDQSSGRAGTRIDVSSQQAVGGVSAYSTDERTVSAVVINTNDAPTLAPDASSLRLRPVAMNSGWSGAITTVSDLLGNAVIDPDPAAELGIALVGVGANGTAFFRIGSQFGWRTVSPASATLLRATDSVGFNPTSGFTGETFITFRLWDQTQGTTANSTADLSQPEISTGGSTAFSREVITARVFVGPAGESPSATFQAVTMRPDQSAAQSVVLTFTEAVTGFDVGDLRLTRDGSPVSLSGATLSGTGQTYTVSGLEQATSAAGTYVLQLPVASTGISDAVGNRLTSAAQVTFSVVSPNLPPSDVALSSASIPENAGTNVVVGIFSTTDPDTNDTFTYSLVPGVGDSDNASFEIVGSELRTRDVFDCETKNSYSIRVRTTDAGGLTFEKALTITVTDVNETPFGIHLSNDQLAENAGIGKIVGQFATDDVDTGDLFSYALVSGDGDTDNQVFVIDGGALRTGIVFDVNQTTTYSVRVRSIDSGGLFIDQVFAITIRNINASPTDVLVSSASLNEGGATGAVVAAFTTTDPDANDTFIYSLVPGIGDIDNESFEIIGNELRSQVFFDYETRNSYSIRVRTTDSGGRSFEKAFTLTVVDVNEAPTSITLTNVLASIPEGPRFEPIRVADIAITDDALGTNEVRLSGTDADKFEIVGDALYLRTDATLDFEASQSLDVTLRVFDETSTAPKVLVNGGFETGDATGWSLFDSGSTPHWFVTDSESHSGSYSLFADNWPKHATQTFSSPVAIDDIIDVRFWSLTDVNASQQVELIFENGTDRPSFNTVGGVWEQRSLGGVIRSDLGDLLGLSVYTWGASPYLVDTWYDDFSVVVAPTQSLSLDVTDVNEAPTAVELTPTSVGLPENLDTTSRIKVADITISDDALGDEILTLSGFDAAMFQIDGLGLYLRAGSVLDREARPYHTVFVNALDESVLGSSAVSARFSLVVGNINEAPTGIALTASLIDENEPSGTLIGTFSTTDPDTSDTFTYSLVAGTGDTDNATFEIVGNELRTREAFDYETKDTYALRVRTTDSGGLFFEKTFIITVVDRTQPYVVALSLVAEPVSGDNSVTYSLTFSEPINGLDSTDFRLITAGVTASSTVTVTGSGETYSVLVNGLSGNGTLALAILDNGTIVDLSGNRLSPSSSQIYGASQTLIAGVNPYSVVIEDFNRDGLMDIASTNHSSGTVSVFLAAGSGTFKPQTTYDAGSGPTSLNLGDFNKDGTLDLVVANYGSGTVSTLIGNGDGTFQPRQALTTGSQPWTPIVADFNVDGNPDIAVANYNTGTIGVLLGNGNGTFQSQQSYIAGSGPKALAAGDLNNDGVIDIIAANWTNYKVSVFLGNGNGKFAPRAEFAAGTTGSPNSVALTDLNLDGTLDALITDSGNTLTVLFGEGNGAFTSPATYTTGVYPMDATVADVNLDGIPDVLTANEASGSVSVLLGKADGTLHPHQNTATGLRPYSVAIGSLNGDTNPDLVAANYESGTLSVFMGAGNSYFVGQVVTIESNAAPTAVALVNSISSIPENTDSTNRLALADVYVTDDGLGTNSLWLSGVDAAVFEIVGASLYLRAGTTIDYEQKEGYAVTVNVGDNASGDSLRLSINYVLAVANVNETPADIALSTATVAENAATGTTIGTASTTDPDTDDTFTYSLVAGVGDTDNASFEIIANELRTRAVFDYETKNSYSIRARITDSGGLSFEKAFTLIITDVNEAPTAITLTNVLASIPEGPRVEPIRIADIVITDDALGVNEVHLSGTDADKFEIIGDGLYLRTDAVVDFETSQLLDVTLSVFDETSVAPSLFVNGGFEAGDASGWSLEDSGVTPHWFVTDAVSHSGKYSLFADNWPKRVTQTFASPVSVKDILDVTFWSLTDVDASQHVELIYENATDGLILTTTRGIWQQRSLGGVIRSDLGDLLGLSVYTWGASPYLVDTWYDDFDVVVAPTQTMSIAVTDVNEAPAEIGLTRSLIDENQPSGTPIGTFSTTDPDTGDTFTYSLVPGTGDTDNASFEIVGNELRTRAVFDYETKNAYTIRVRSTDSGGLSTEQPFQIAVADLNERPRVRTPGSLGFLEDVPGNVVFPDGFVVDDSSSLSVSLEVSGGSLTTAPSEGIAASGDSTRRTFVGAVADLNRFFASLGSVTYTPDANSRLPEVLTVVVSDGEYTTSSRVPVVVAAVNDAPEASGRAVLAAVDTSTSPNEIAGATVRELFEPTFSDGLDAGPIVSPVTAAVPARTVREARNAYAFAALKADGAVVTWGDPRYGGDSSAVTDQLASGVVEIYSNTAAFAALKADGSVVTWGHPVNGGNSAAVAESLTGGVKQVVSWGIPFVSVNGGMELPAPTGAHGFAALKSDGSVILWGTPSLLSTHPVYSQLSSGVVQLYANATGIAALKADGSVVSWGQFNNWGPVDALSADVVEIFAGRYTFAALKSDGSLVAWGDSATGGDTTSVAALLSSGVVHVQSTWGAFAALKDDGSVVTWGSSTLGGDSTAVANQLSGRVSRLYSTNGAFSALMDDGSLISWGGGLGGSFAVDFASQLDHGVIDVVPSSVDFAALKADGSVVVRSPYAMQAGNIVRLFANQQAFAGITADGAVLVGGNLSYGGDLGVATEMLSSGVVDIFATSTAFAALKSDGSVVTWGNPMAGGDSSGVESQVQSGVVAFANPFTADRYVAGDELAGIAITANAANSTEGVWQYSEDGGNSWTPIPTSGLSSSNALMLDSSDRIRFQPVETFVGVPGSLTAHLVDSGEGAVETGTLRNVSENGGTSPISATTVRLETSVLANQAPTAVVLANVITSVPENAAIDGPVKVADIVITDDGLGANQIIITEADAGLFEASADGLYLKQGMSPDFESRSILEVGVSVFDPTAVSTSVVTNGGFEAGDKSGWMLQGDLGWPGKWTVVSDETRSGEFSLFADNWSRTVSRTFATPLVAADVIDFSFWTHTSTEARTVVTIVYENGTQSHGFATTAGVWEQRQLQPLIRTDLGGIKSFGVRTFHNSANQDDVDTYYDDFNIRTSPVYPVATITPLTITVADVNEAPTRVMISNRLLAENAALGTTVSSFVTADPDINDTFTYSLVTSVGDVDSSFFEIIGNELRTREVFDYETKNAYFIRVRSTDSGGLSYERDFTITVTDVNEAPTSVSLVNALSQLSETTSTSTATKLADIQVADDALGTNTLSLSGPDAASFEISNQGSLYLKADVSLSYATKPTLSVTISARDTSIVGSSPVSTNYTLDIIPRSPHLTTGAGGQLFIDGQPVTYAGSPVTASFRSWTIFEAAVIRGQNVFFGQHNSGVINRLYTNADWSLVGGLYGVGSAYSIYLPRSARGPNVPFIPEPEPLPADLLIPVEISGTQLRIDPVGQLYANQTMLTRQGSSAGIKLTDLANYRPIAVMRENTDSTWQHTLLWQHRINQSLIEWQFNSGWGYQGNSRVPSESTAALELAYQFDINRDGSIG